MQNRIAGDDQSVAEELRSLVTSLAGRTAVQPTRALAAPKTAAAAAPAQAIDQTEISFPTEPEQEEVEPEAAEEEPSNGSGPKRSYTFKAPKFLHDLDLTKATKPLADFIAEKGNATEIMDRYIVIAVWLKEHMGVDEFKIDHIWTAYHALGWKAQFPENHSQPLRDLKSKKNFVTKEKGVGYKVSWPGEQYVAKMGAA